MSMIHDLSHPVYCTEILLNLWKANNCFALFQRRNTTISFVNACIKREKKMIENAISESDVSVEDSNGDEERR